MPMLAANTSAPTPKASALRASAALPAGYSESSACDVGRPYLRLSARTVLEKKEAPTKALVRPRTISAAGYITLRIPTPEGSAMHLTQEWANLAAYAGIGFTFLSFLMKGMLPLRALALGGNISFIVYGVYEWLPPSLILNCALLPINLKRLWDIRKLSEEIKQATERSPVSSWLLPHMTRRAFKPGEV